MADGTRKWVFDRGLPSLSLRGLSPPVAGNGLVFIGYDDGSVVALRENDGLRAWEQRVAEPDGRTELDRVADIDGELQVGSDDLFAASFHRQVMPLLFGRLGQAHFLGLPGNPVSVLATFLTLGRALLDGIQGNTAPRATLRARLRADLRKTHPRLEFLRGRLACDDDGRLSVEPNPADGSHRLRAAAASNALIVLPEGEGTYSAGTVLDVLPYADWR